MNALLAIHQPDLRLAIDLLLREEPGIRVVGVVRDTEALLTLCKTLLPDLLLLEWKLPGKPIAKTLSEIKSIEKVPFVIMLGDYEVDADIAHLAGADAFVEIGWAPNRLLDVIHQLSPQSNASNQSTEVI